VIARHRAGFNRLHQPLRHQAFRKLTLRIFETENGPLAAGIEQAFQLVLVVPARIYSQVRGAHLAIQPETGSYVERAAPAFLAKCKQKVHRVHQMWTFAQQLLAFA
jgi:hypothetical protein